MELSDLTAPRSYWDAVTLALSACRTGTAYAVVLAGEGVGPDGTPVGPYCYVAAVENLSPAGLDFLGDVVLVVVGA